MAELPEERIPKRAREIFEKGVGAVERNNPDYAMDMFMAALTIEPRYLKARRYLRAVSIKTFTDAHKGPPDQTMSLLKGLSTWLGGLVALKTGKPLQALEKAENLLRQAPLNLQFIRLLGQAAEKADMPEVALQTLELVRDYFPENPTVIFWMGTLYLKTQRLETACQCFETVLKMRPSDVAAEKALKDAMAAQSMAKDGWSNAQSFRGVVRDAKEAAILEQQQKTAHSAEGSDLLIAEMRDKIEKEPKNLNYRRALANLHIKAEKFDQAFLVLEEAQKMAGFADPQIDQEMAAIRVRQFEARIKQARAKNDGKTAEALEQERDAFIFEDVRSRVERYPNDLQLRYEYGILQYERGQLNEAVQQFQLSQRNPQRRIRSLYYIAMCFIQKQQYDLAMEQLEKAASEVTEMNDLKKDILYQLGALTEEMGDFAKAVNKYYKEIYQVDIGYKDVSSKIEQLYSRQKSDAAS
ncbi:MAG: tetratricopeptide repeat protein [Lentisphaerae bacterium]|nr:tetratricopeptide repeat protein [Lentisphaerota bacterium]